VPLPLVTPENEFYWTAGADGVLRMRHCRCCDALIHPPRPACHRCRSSALDTVDLSGRGQIVGVTVNHQQWGPEPPEPYALATVALEEDYRVRVTGRVVGADPHSVTIGRPVTVDFQQAKDVWIPQFRLAAGPARALPPLEEDPSAVRVTARPPVSTDRYEEKSAITGIGMSRLGRRLMADPLALTVEACRAAVEDAGLTFDDIDGLATYPGGTVPGGFSEGGLTLLEETLRLRPVWYNGGAEVPGPGGSVVAAMLAIAAGLCRHVLVYRTVWQATHTELLRSGRLPFGGGGRVGPPMDFLLPVGAMSAAHPLAIIASHYLHRYRVGRETLGLIALNQRANAARNPTAIYRSPMTMDDYLSARPVTTPFGLYDCDVPCDGSIALVISRADGARDLRQPPVRFAAVGTQITERVSWDQSTLTHEPQVLGSAAHLWSRTDLRPSDVDVAELYDGFTFNCLSWLEGLGFCGVGEAADFLDGGKRIALDGELPLNTHGGQLSHGRTHGFGLLHEAVTQLRGHGGDRQVPDAEVAVVSSGGLTPSSCMLLLADR